MENSVLGKKVRFFLKDGELEIHVSQKIVLSFLSNSDMETSLPQYLWGVTDPTQYYPQNSGYWVWKKRVKLDIIKIPHRIFEIYKFYRELELFFILNFGED